MIKINNNSKGFTLVELLVVIVIIAMLLAFVIPNFGDARKQSRDAERKAEIESVRTALELYKADNDYYPAGGCSSTDLPNCSVVAGVLTGGGYIKEMPSDESGTGYYFYTGQNCVSGDCTDYILGAILEAENPGGTADDGCGISRSCGSGQCNYCTYNP